MSDSYLAFDPVGGPVVVATVALVLLALLWVVGPEVGRTTPRQRLALRAVRATIVALLLLIMLRPTRVVVDVEKQAATLVLLLDRSRSMEVTDELGGRPRWAALRQVLDDAAPALEGLSADVELKVLTFDADLAAAEQRDGQVVLDESPAGTQTAIGAALEEVLRREAGQRLLGVVLLSDGAQRAYPPHDAPPQLAARRLGDLGCPLYTLAFGQARGLGQSRDVAVRDLLTSETIFAKNRLQAGAQVDVRGYPNRPIPVRMLFETGEGEMEVVAGTSLQTAGDGAALDVELGYVPEKPGEYKLTLEVAPQEGELVTTNNRLSTFVTVREGGLRVLYLEGALRVEQRFLRTSLDASPDVELDFERFDTARREAWPVASEDRFERDRYDVYIVGDLDSSALRAEAWQELAERVDGGAGLMMLGGFHSFGPGGYQQTALGELLPIAIDRLERQGFGDPPAADLHLKGPLRMVPTPTLGARHPLMALGESADNLQLWAKLPPLDGANRFRGLKPVAAVLAESEGPQRAPLLVAGQWGNGRVLAFAGDSTWRWVLEGHAPLHKRFWRQVVLWLAQSDAAEEGQVWIKLTRRRYAPGARVEVEVGANNALGDRVEGATFRAEVIAPDGTRRPVQLARRGEKMTGTVIETLDAGDYTIELAAEQAGAPLGETRARFLVFEQDLELDNPAADPGLLAGLARATASAGGRSLAPEELPGLLAQLVEQAEDLQVETEQRHSYWDTWPILLALVGLLSLEWYLRKRWGLV